jgi:hypothetical protein
MQHFTTDLYEDQVRKTKPNSARICVCITSDGEQHDFLGRTLGSVPGIALNFF